MILRILGEIVSVILASLLTRQLGFVLIHDPDLYDYVTAGVAIGVILGLVVYHVLVPRLTVPLLVKAVAVWLAATLLIYLAYQAVWGDSQSHADLRRNTGKALALLLSLLGAVASTPPAVAASDHFLDKK